MTALAAFNALCDPSHVHPIHPEAYQAYLTDNQVTSLAFTRAPNSLYSEAHCLARQQLFNGLPQADRIRLFLSKIAPIAGAVHAYHPGAQSYAIQDVHDCGASHSVYIATYGHKKIVIKTEAPCYQSYFVALLAYLDWPAYVTQAIGASGVTWRLSDWISDTTLYTGLHGTAPDPAWLTALAQHAALGDVFGRGDRHNKNYMITGTSVLPIDIGYLFYPNNDRWLADYIQGGITEINALAAYSPTPDLLSQFMADYHHTSRFIYDSYHDIMTFKRDYDPEIATQLDALVWPRLCYLRENIKQRTQWYTHHFAHYTYRKRLKPLFYTILSQYKDSPMPDILRLYQYQDPDDQTAFFALNQPDRLKIIEALIQTHLNQDTRPLLAEALAYWRVT